VELNLPTEIRDAVLANIKVGHLTRLHLENTPITDVVRASESAG
jgi:hypothetical protein